MSADYNLKIEKVWCHQRFYSFHSDLKQTIPFMSMHGLHHQHLWWCICSTLNPNSCAHLTQGGRLFDVSWCNKWKVGGNAHRHKCQCLRQFNLCVHVQSLIKTSHIRRERGSCRISRPPHSISLLLLVSPLPQFSNQRVSRVLHTLNLFTYRARLRRTKYSGKLPVCAPWLAATECP